MCTAHSFKPNLPFSSCTNNNQGTHPTLVALVALVAALASRGSRVSRPLTSLRQGEPHRLVALLALGKGWQRPRARAAAPRSLPVVPGLLAVADPRACADLLQLLLHGGKVSEALPTRDGGALPVERAWPHLSHTQPQPLVPRNPRAIAPTTCHQVHSDHIAKMQKWSKEPTSLHARRWSRGYCSSWRSSALRRRSSARDGSAQRALRRALRHTPERAQLLMCILRRTLTYSLLAQCVRALTYAHARSPQMHSNVEAHTKVCLCTLYPHSKMCSCTLLGALWRHALIPLTPGLAWATVGNLPLCQSTHLSLSSPRVSSYSFVLFLLFYICRTRFLHFRIFQCHRA